MCKILRVSLMLIFCEGALELITATGQKRFS